MAMAEEAMVPAAAEVAALRLAAEVAEPATVGVAEAKRRRGSEAEGKRRRAQPDACLCARLGGGERAWTHALAARLPHHSCGDKQRTFLEPAYGSLQRRDIRKWSLGSSRLLLVPAIPGYE